MSKNRWKGSEPSGVDLEQALRSFEEDCGCSAQVTVKKTLGEGRDLYICAEAYTITNGVKIGVARYNQGWTEGGRGLDACMMLALHHLYEKAYELAHAGGYQKTYKGRV